MCGAQMRRRRNTNTGILILNPSNKNPQRGATKRQPQYRALTELRTTLEFQRLGLVTVSGCKNSILCRYNL